MIKYASFVKNSKLQFVHNHIFFRVIRIRNHKLCVSIVIIQRISENNLNSRKVYKPKSINRSTYKRLLMKLIILSVLALVCQSFHLEGRNQSNDQRLDQEVQVRTLQQLSQVTQGEQTAAAERNSKGSKQKAASKISQGIQQILPTSFQKFSKEGFQDFDNKNIELNQGMEVIPKLLELLEEQVVKLTEIKQNSKKLAEIKQDSKNKVKEEQSKKIVKDAPLGLVQINDVEILKKPQSNDNKKDQIAQVPQQANNETAKESKSNLNTQNKQQNVQNQTTQKKQQSVQNSNLRKSNVLPESSKKEQQDLLAEENPLLAKKEENNIIQEKKTENKPETQVAIQNKEVKENKEVKQDKESKEISNNKENNDVKEVKEKKENKDIQEKKQSKENKKNNEVEDAKEDKDIKEPQNKFGSVQQKSTEETLNKYLEKLKKMEYPFTIPSIIGASLLFIFVIVLLIVSVCCCCKKCKKRRAQSEKSSPVSSDFQVGENVFNEVPPSSDRGQKTGSLGKYKYGRQSY